MSEAVAEVAPQAEEPKAEVAAEVAAPKEAKTPEARHKLKVNGKEVELPLSEILKRAQIAEAGQGAFQEAAALKREKAELAAAIKANPRAELARLAKEHGGKELRDLAMDLLHDELTSQLEEANLSEDAKEARRLRAELAKLKKEQEDGEKTAHAKRVEEEHQRLTSAVIGTLEALPENLRKQEWVANRVVDAWSYITEHADELVAKGIDLRTVTPAKVAEQVLKNLRGLSKEQLAAMKDEEIDEVIDEPTRKRLMAKWAQAKGEPQHPALTSKAQVRDGAQAAAKVPPRITGPALQRRMSRPFGS